MTQPELSLFPIEDNAIQTDCDLLRSFSSIVLYQHPVPETPYISDFEPRYLTGFGELTFEQLYAKTHRIVGHTLREKVGMENPEDIDDCMQAGYLNVWKFLQRQPDAFADKPKRYIVQAVVLRSKAQRYAHLRHNRKIIYDADASHQQHLTTPQPTDIDTWIDLSHAIQRVAEHVTALENPLYLLALYTLITEVKTLDVVRLFGDGLSTITRVKRRLRATLAQELPEYGVFPELHVKPLKLPQVRSFALHQLHKQLISPYLFDDIPVDGRHLQPVDLEHTSFPDSPDTLFIDPQEALPQEPTYHTKWRGACTLQQLLEDTHVRRVAYSKMRSLGNIDEDADDCFQIGATRLWKTLQTTPDLLAEQSAGWLGVWIAHSGSRREFWKHRVLKANFDDPEFDLETADERLELYPHRRRERWATFATQTDERIDFELFMNTLAQRYDGDPLKLFALYSLTTSVKMKDTLSVVGAHKNQMIQARNGVRQDMQMLLQGNEDVDDSVEQPWEHSDAKTEEEKLSAIERVAERVVDNQRLLLALYIVTTSAKRKDVTELFGIGITWFRREVRQIKQMLAEELRTAHRRRSFKYPNS